MTPVARSKAAVQAGVLEGEQAGGRGEAECVWGSVGGGNSVEEAEMKKEVSIVHFFFP